MAKRKITAEDIEKDPSLVDKGYNVGDEYDFEEDEVSSEETNADESTETNEGGEPEDGEGNGENGGNGTNNPGKKPPFTP